MRQVDVLSGFVHVMSVSLNGQTEMASVLTTT